MRKKRSLTAAQGNGAGADAMQRVSSCHLFDSLRWLDDSIEHQN